MTDAILVACGTLQGEFSFAAKGMGICLTESQSIRPTEGQGNGEIGRAHV